MDANYFDDYAMFKFLLKGEFKWTVPKDFYLNQCNKNSSTGCLFEFNFEYPKELESFEKRF